MLSNYAEFVFLGVVIKMVLSAQDPETRVDKTLSYS